MVVSTGYREGDLRLYIIAAPDTTNAMVIEPVPTPVPAGAVGLPFQGRATFQALNGVTRYRLCLHAASTSTSGYLMAFDTFSVGPQAIQSTTPVTDWVPYTCTLTASAIPAASVSAFYRRVGDSVECRVETRNFTSYGSGVYSWSLPPGLKVDLSKGVSLAAGLTDTWNAWGGDTGSSIGAGAATVITSPFKSELQVFAATETTVIAAIPVQSSTATVNVDLLDIIGSSNSGGPFSRISFTFKVPVLGWSSSVQMSSDAGDGRVVAATYYLSANQSTVSQINFDTKLTDTHNAVTTGVGIWKFTAPVPGIYLFSIGVQKDAGTGTIVVYKNNSSFRTALVFDANFKTAVSQIELAAGDFIDFRPSPLSIIIGGPPSSVNAAFFNISRVSSSSAIAGTETVAASYWLTANQAITAQSTTINYDAREFDTHGAVTTGASWSFVAPVAGTYHIGGMMTASGPCNCVLYKNGLIYKYVGAQASGASTANSSLIKLNAGDSISFRGNTSVTVTGAAALSLNPSHISIMRVGN
jgi:hypothetical protein